MYGFTRGEQNNNPMNIRISKAAWKGKITPSKDTDFEQFDSPINGIRAGAKLLSNYYRLDGLSTIQSIISRWAPSNENNTNSYVADVSQRMAMDSNASFDVCKPTNLKNLCKAIIWHENGRCQYRDEDIIEAVSNALSLNKI